MFFKWPCQNHVGTMFGLVLLLDQAEHCNFQPWVSMVQGPCLWSPFLGTKSGPCWDHVWPSFTSRLATALRFSRLSNLVLGPFLWSVYFLGPCQIHVWTFTSFDYWVFTFEDHFDQFGAMFGLALLPDQPELWNFQDSIIWSKVHVYGVLFFVIFQDDAFT